MRTLYGLTVSQFTEKARFALDHHGLAYVFHEHVPMLGEVFLRLKSKGRARDTKATVPLLVDGDASLTTSLAIARHADRIGKGSALFAAGRGAGDAIDAWAAASDQVIEIGRTSIFRGMPESPGAQRESVPAWVPDALRGAFAPSVALGVRFLASKHESAPDLATVIASARPHLEKMRAVLANAEYLVGSTFSFADAAMAAALGVVLPHESAPIGPATRALLTQDAIAKEFDDLLLWRDEVYRKHRKAPVSPS